MLQKNTMTNFFFLISSQHELQTPMNTEQMFLDFWHAFCQFHGHFYNFCQCLKRGVNGHATLNCDSAQHSQPNFEHRHEQCESPNKQMACCHTHHCQNLSFRKATKESRSKQFSVQGCSCGGPWHSSVQLSTWAFSGQR